MENAQAFQGWPPYKKHESHTKSNMTIYDAMEIIESSIEMHDDIKIREWPYKPVFMELTLCMVTGKSYKGSYMFLRLLSCSFFSRWQKVWIALTKLQFIISCKFLWDL